VYLSAASVLALGPAVGRAFATTTVTGDSEVNAPLVIDPSASPTDPETAEVNAGAIGTLAFIERMPVTKVVQRITVGDVAKVAAAPGCDESVPVRLYVHEYPDGNSVGGNQIAYSSQTVDLPTSPAKLAFDIPPTTFSKGTWLQPHSRVGGEPVP
jgi:hypothetical protein